MVLAARSMSESWRMAGSRRLMAATIGSMPLTSRSFFVPKILARIVSTIMEGLGTGGRPQLLFYSVRGEGRGKRRFACGRRRFTPPALGQPRASGFERSEANARAGWGPLGPEKSQPGSLEPAPGRLSGSVGFGAPALGSALSPGLAGGPAGSRSSPPELPME